MAIPYHCPFVPSLSSSFLWPTHNLCEICQIAATASDELLRLSNAWNCGNRGQLGEIGAVGETVGNGGAGVICNMFYLTCGSCSSQWRLSNWRSELSADAKAEGGVPQWQLITISSGWSFAKLLPAGIICGKWVSGQAAQKCRQMGVGVFSPFIFLVTYKNTHLTTHFNVCQTSALRDQQPAGKK